jgi:hypothetical protein
VELRGDRSIELNCGDRARAVRLHARHEVLEVRLLIRAEFGIHNVAAFGWRNVVDVRQME